MLGLPHSTEVNRPLPKAQLYKKFEMKQAQRDAFDTDVARMEIVNFIAPQTLPAIAVGSEVQAVFVVDVELKRRDYDTKNILLISKLIPHRIIFALRYEGMLQIAVYHTKLFVTGWMAGNYEGAQCIAPLRGPTLDSIWVNVVCQIGNLDSSLLTANSSLEKLTEQIRVDDERNRVLRQIEALERQMRSTAQPRRQRELYKQIQQLRKM